LNGGFLPINDGVEEINFLLTQGEIDTKIVLDQYLLKFPRKKEELGPNGEVPDD